MDRKPVVVAGFRSKLPTRRPSPLVPQNFMAWTSTLTIPLQETSMSGLRKLTTTLPSVRMLNIPQPPWDPEDPAGRPPSVRMSISFTNPALRFCDRRAQASFLHTHGCILYAHPRTGSHRLPLS